ncbi:MscS Small-conductance mechanosensitive channel [Methylophilaceae bacterium]|jgi:small-conductance mechanosensitive channel
MNQEMQLVWTELFFDLTTPFALWQLAIIAMAASFAWAINSLVRSKVMRSAPESWKLGIGGINRVLFPLISLIGIQLATLALTLMHSPAASLLHLVSTLLIALVLIRIAAYAVRYIMAPSGIVKTLENSITSFILIVLGLYLSGLLLPLLDVLESVQFSLGKSQLNLLLVLQAILTIILTIFIALSLSRVLENKLMRNEHINMNMRVVMSKLLRGFLLVIALLIGLSAVGLDVTLLSVFGGALGVGLGFGLQRIASNYVSGFIILLDRSMQIGDVLTVDNHYGVVTDLRTRYLVLHKLDDTEVIIPNEMLIINPVINHSHTNPKARVQLPVQISYDSPLETAMQVIAEAAKQHPRVLATPAPTVHIKGFADNGIDLILTIWMPDPEEGPAVMQSELYLAIWRTFKANNISIPYPQREVRILAGSATS